MRESSNILDLCGWVHNPDEVDRVLAGMPMPLFGAAAPHLSGSWDGKSSIMLWEACKKVTGANLPADKQTIGDCFLAGTLVTMADGTRKPIETVQIGDWVVSARNVPRQVTALIRKPYSGELVKIRVQGHKESIEATPDHRFVHFPGIQSGSRSGQKHHTVRKDWTWKPIGQLEAGDRVLAPFGLDNETGEDPVLDLKTIVPDALVEGNSLRMSNGRHVCKRFVRLDPELCWLIGIYLAEGGIDRAKDKKICGVTFSLSAKEGFLAERIKAGLQRAFGVDSRIGAPPKRRHSILLVRCASMIVARFFKALVPGNVYSKAVPPILFTLSRSHRLACLRGWLHGDGSFGFAPRSDGRHYRLNLVGTSASTELRQGFYRMALSCRLRATVTHRPQTEARPHLTGDVHFRGGSALALYPELATDVRPKIRIARTNREVTQDGLALAVQDVSRRTVEDETVYCLEVEEDHSFIANGYGVSNCVSHGHARGVDYLQCVQAALTGEWSYVEGQDSCMSEAMYGIAREIGHDLSNQDGAVGAWAAEGLRTVGFVSRRGKPYDGRIAKQFGRQGCPAELKQQAHDHVVKTTSLVRNFQELGDALANGYPVTVCSNQGFSMERDADGFCRAQGSWAHCMLIIGIIVTSSGRRGAVILQSWGQNVPSGPTVLGMPDNSFGAEERTVERMLGYGDSWSLSQAVGYPAQKLDWFV